MSSTPGRGWGRIAVILYYSEPSLSLPLSGGGAMSRRDRIAGRVTADEGRRTDGDTVLEEGLRHRPYTAMLDRNQQSGAVEGAVGNRDDVGERSDIVDCRGAPAGDAHAPHFGLGHHGIGGDAGDHEYRHGGRVVGAFDERQPRDNFGSGFKFERRPPRAGAGGCEGGNEAEIALRARYRFDNPGSAPMRLERH